MAPIEELAVEETPLMKELKVADDDYLALEREYERACLALQVKFTKMQQPHLDKRAKLLAGEGGVGPKTGTPAMTGFWVTALKNHPMLEEMIETYDVPVLEYITDISKELLDETDANNGFKLVFKFAENPYFTNTDISKTYRTKEESPYTGDMYVERIEATEIEWKTGKDVTVKPTKPAAAKGKSIKGKIGSKAGVTEPRPSFFRHFFRSLEAGMALPDDLEIDQEMLDDDDSPSEVVSMVMGQDHEIGGALRDQVIPFAVRWFTGEAAPAQHDCHDDEEEGEEEDDENSMD